VHLEKPKCISYSSWPISMQNVLEIPTVTVLLHLELFSGSGACVSNPCYNGGNCTESMYGGYDCMCASSYTGYNCESGKIIISLLNNSRICINVYH